MGPIVCRLFDVAVGATSWTYAAPTLSDDAVRKEIEARLTAGDRVFVYFDEKVGGEISLSGSDKSPEMSFDVTLVELVREQGAVALSKFAIIEVQTIDFHGSYGAAVKALEQALDLHEADFATQVQAHPEWAGRKIEGPNIANVVKRTFWQMLFKFQFGTVPQCAGTALAIPRAVWDSWQPFLGKPTLTQAADGTSRLEAPLASLPEKIPAWIYVFEADASSKTSPNPIVIQQVIGTSAEALDHHALTEAPANAKALLLSDIGIYATLRARLKNYWPQLVGAAPSKPNLTKS